VPRYNTGAPRRFAHSDFVGRETLSIAVPIDSRLITD
jgi:hypothetical protein